MGPPFSAGPRARALKPVALSCCEIVSVPMYGADGPSPLLCVIQGSHSLLEQNYNNFKGTRKFLCFSSFQHLCHIPPFIWVEVATHREK